MNKKDWKQEKQQWREDIQSIEIPENEAQKVIPELQHKIDKLYEKGSYKYQYYKSQYKNIEDNIKSLKKAFGDSGSNKEERQANAYQKLLYYPSGNKNDEDTKDLIKLRNEIRKRYNFYNDYVMRNLKAKSNRISNIIGAGKLDAQISGAYGA